MKIENYKLKIAAIMLICALFPVAAPAAVLTKPPTNLGLVGYWPMNENTGTVASDFSGNRNRGILTGGPTWGEGKRGKALSFDANDDLVTAGTPASLNITGALTISAWIYPRTFGSSASSFRGRIVDKENDFVSGYSFSLYDPNTAGVPNDTFALFINASGGNLNCFASNGSIVLRKWQHVAVTLDSSKNCIPYVNGAKATTTAGFIMGSLPTSGSNSFVIGNNSGNTREFDGSLDEVRVYNRALSATEMQALYKSGAAKIVQTAITKINAPQNDKLTNGLVGMWSFNGPDMTNATATDVSGNGNNGTLTNGPKKVIGKIGQALNFNGVNDYVDVVNESNFDFSGGSFSAAFWMNTSQVDQRKGLVTKSNTGDHQWFILTSTAADGNTIEAVLCSATDCSTNSSIFGNIPINGGSWKHIVVEFSSANTSTPTKKVYINGVDHTGSSIANSFTGMRNGTQTVKIGKRGDGIQYNGLIDEVRVYNRALSTAEIYQLYNMGR
ncbi:MAG: LamG domain protein jellyroll fold domain protein [Parcubacteria group bacterium GW2011_GWC1_43_30]|nr:MAG: LamG domain protein jellyroll fold domain protein [Parcubacteria group bacterium GW2011_GWC1_43_30]